MNNIYGEKDAELMPLKYKNMFAKWKENNTVSKIAASFEKIEDVSEMHIQHFSEYEYMWKPMHGGIWGGIWMTDKIDYVHLVLATTPVVEFLLNLKKNGSRGNVKLSRIE